MLGTRTIRVLAGAAVLTALGFGTTQALAKPAPYKESRIICPFGQHACSCPGGVHCTFNDVPCTC